MRIKAVENWKLLSILGSKTTSNFLPGFGNSRPDPKIGVAYKKNVYSLLTAVNSAPIRSDRFLNVSSF